MERSGGGGVDNSLILSIVVGWRRRRICVPSRRHSEGVLFRRWGGRAGKTLLSTAKTRSSRRTRWADGGRREWTGGRWREGFGDGGKRRGNLVC